MENMDIFRQALDKHIETRRDARDTLNLIKFLYYQHL